jgi:hypothetical protein
MAVIVTSVTLWAAWLLVFWAVVVFVDELLSDEPPQAFSSAPLTGSARPTSPARFSSERRFIRLPTTAATLFWVKSMLTLTILVRLTVGAALAGPVVERQTSLP